MPVIDNLVAAWELNEASGNALDSHGASTLTDNGTVGAATGLVYATARDCEGSVPEFFSRTDDAALSVGDLDFTVEAWVQFESLAHSTVVSKCNADTFEYDLDSQGDGNLFRFRIANGSSFANLATVQSATFGALSTATWYHVVAWHDSVNNLIGIAVNAGTPDTTPVSTGSHDSDGEFRIGSLFGFGVPWDGLIGPVRFWKKVLTSGERTWLYNGGAGRTYAAIVAEAGPSFTLVGRTVLDYGPD